MSRNHRIVEQLGMPHGTACNRLRKMILLDLLKRLRANICFKCGESIQVVEDLSIEHKQPWEGISAELFWSLENIAFSHLRCNTKDRSAKGVSNIALRREHPAGKHWCITHKKYLPAENFGVRKKHWSGLNEVCKEHQHPERE